MEVVGVDVARVRGLYPTLAGATAQLDGGFAALQPESVIRAIISTLRSAPAQPGSSSNRSRQSATRVLRARNAAADLVCGRADDVVLGDSPVSLMLRFAGLLSSDWQLGDEIVLNRLDADYAAQPWVQAARGRGVVVRWAEVDLDSGEVPAWQYDELINRRTRVVTVAMGNAATGAVPDVRAIADLAHEHGALVVVDAGLAPLYVSLDLGELGADLIVFAAPVFGGPTVSALVARPGLLTELSELTGHDDPLPVPQRFEVLPLPVPQRFEVLPLPVELMDGFTAAVDHLAGLDEHARGTRRKRLAASITSGSRYTRQLYRRLDDGLRTLPRVTVLGAAERALPVVAFTIAGRSPADVGAQLQRKDVSVWTGPTGLSEVLHAFGADEVGGAAFVGIMPHTAAGEIDQLLESLGSIVR